MWFCKNKGIVDSVSDKDRRIGIIFLKFSNTFSSDQYTIVEKSKNTNLIHNVVMEVREVFNDKDFSKIEIIKISYNNSKFSNRKIRKSIDTWILSDKIHWLTPSTPVDRNNKLNEILS